VNSVFKWGVIVLIAIIVLKHPAQAGAWISNAVNAVGTLVTNL
jgi:2-keto-4-pentenoate hydratase